MRTITIWNVPVDVAEVTVKALREKAANMIANGEPMKEVNPIIYTIESIEEEISRTDEP